MIENLLSSTGLVALKISEENEKGNRIYYSNLIELLEKPASSATVNKSVKLLEDMGIVISKWRINSSNRRWIRELTPTEDAKDILKELQCCLRRLEKTLG